MSTSETNDETRLQRIESYFISDPTLSWRDRGYTVFGGIIVITILVLFGSIMEQTIDGVDISGTLYTSLHLMFVGLGTGHYLGLSLKGAESSRRWFYFGCFVPLFVYAIFATDALIFEIIPLEILLVLSVLAPIILHHSPLLEENEDFANILNIFAAHVSRAAIVLIATLDYIIRLLVTVSDWWSSLQTFSKILTVAVSVLLVLGLLTIIGELLEKR
jgi:hypothetical protein